MNQFEIKMSENRVSNSQLKELLDFLTVHHRLANNTGLGPRERQKHETLWEQIARKLNSHPGGAKKSSLRWKRYWTDIKFKSKTRLINKRTTGTLEDLGDVDKKILSIISKGPKKPKLEVDVPDFNSQESTLNVDGSEVKWPTLTLSHEENDTDPLIQFLPVKDTAEEEESSEAEQSNIKKITSKNPELGWIMELDERRVVSEEKLADAANKMAQAAMINAEAAKTIAQATLMLAQSQQTLIDILHKSMNKNNTNNDT